MPLLKIDTTNETNNKLHLETVPHNVTIAHVDYEHNYIVWYTCTEDDVNSHSMF